MAVSGDHEKASRGFYSLLLILPIRHRRQLTDDPTLQQPFTSSLGFLFSAIPCVVTTCHSCTLLSVPQLSLLFIFQPMGAQTPLLEKRIEGALLP
ncbi:hypothetical protein LY78DRAFT_342971 [Colletotrichum sublineola]|nr:hypothetical protein LY78DRAFT_342971 [Colletotrichum sublineola]